MNVQIEPDTEAKLLASISALMGGKRVLRRKVTTPLEAHELLREGLPGNALVSLAGQMMVLSSTTLVETALGFSLRTFQRIKTDPDKPMNLDQSGRTWKFAEILSRATELLGSQKYAEIWMEQPAIGLDGRTPIDLISTPAGLEIVETYLGRLEYGVYA